MQIALPRAAALALLLAACGASSHKPTTTAAPISKTPAAKTPAPAAAQVMTLKELQNGDAACYVVMTPAKGEDVNLPGDFELCAGGGHDATPLIGKHVTYTTKKANVLAASCEGNQDCGKSDEVDAVDTITAAP